MINSKTWKKDNANSKTEQNITRIVSKESDPTRVPAGTFRGEIKITFHKRKQSKEMD
jgi:hypothetical protein